MVKSNRQAKKTSEQNNTILKTNLWCGLIIALCFLWTATGYLTWMYHLLDYTEASNVDWLTEVIGYLFQVMGLVLFGLVLRHKSSLLYGKSSFIACILTDFALIILSALVHGLPAILVMGYLMNLFHGIIAGFYLTLLTTLVDSKYCPIVFGAAYAVSSIASWGISLPNNSTFLHSEYALILYGIFVSITIAIILIKLEFPVFEDLTYTETNISSGLIVLAALTVILVSMTRGIGFYFPMADISKGISLEFSRAFYAIGLILAGIVGNKSRKYGAICCLSSLFFPFAMIALSNEVSISIVLWILGYCLFGFLAVFRVVLFSDIARTRKEFLYMAGFGLMFGRIGDAAGSLTGILLKDKLIALVIIASICFVLTYAIFFMLYNKLYMPLPQPAPSQEERLHAFIQKHQLSSREIEVLNLITEGSSNSEISAKLFISENTVKFHVRNILKKTSCSNRTELLAMLNQSCI